MVKLSALTAGMGLKAFSNCSSSWALGGFTFFPARGSVPDQMPQDGKGLPRTVVYRVQEPKSSQVRWWTPDVPATIPHTNAQTKCP